MTVRVLKELYRKYDPDFVFLMETKKNHKMEKFRKRMGFGESMYVEPEGLSGGLALWWKKEVMVRVLIGNKNLIDTVVMVPRWNERVRIFWNCRTPILRIELRFGKRKKERLEVVMVLSCV